MHQQSTPAQNQRAHSADLAKLQNVMLLYSLILQSDFPETNILTFLYKTNGYQNLEIHIERITLSSFQTFSDFINCPNFVLYN